MTFITIRAVDTGDSHQDFLVPVEGRFPMSYAYSMGSAAWKKHEEYGVWSLQLTENGGIDEGNLDINELLRVDEYETHGWWMWSAWYVVGLLLLVSKRYMKKTWKFSHYVHALLGYFTLFVTIYWSFKMLEWRFSDSLHYILGTITLFVTIFGALLGSFTAFIMKFYNGDKEWSEVERVERVAKFHRYAGYLTLFIGNITIMTGCVQYFEDVLHGDKRKMLGVASMMSFILLVILFETIYRLRNRLSLGHIKTPQVSVDG